MPRIRTIKPEFWSNDRLSELPVDTHMFAAGLLNYCDDEGYFHAHEKKLGIEIFPLRDEYRTCTVHLQHLSEIGFLSLHKGSDGRTYGHVVKFRDHQVINKPKPSKIKNLIDVPDEYGTDTVPLPSGKEQGKELELELGNGNGNGNGKEHGGEENSPKKPLPQIVSKNRFDEFWQAYPPTDRRTAKKQCFEKWQKNNLDDEADLILSHIDEMKRTDGWKRGYEPSSLTYLNQRRWDGIDQGMQIPSRVNESTGRKNNTTVDYSKIDYEEEARQITRMLQNQNAIQQNGD